MTQQADKSQQSCADPAPPECGTVKRGNAKKTHDSSRARAFLSGFITAWQLYDAVPEAEDLFAGAALLKTSGNTATRATVKRAVLFSILRSCPNLTTDSVKEATGGRYGPAQVLSYTAHARVVSNALAMLLDARPELEELWTLGPDADDLQFLTYTRCPNRGYEGSPTGEDSDSADQHSQGTSVEQTSNLDALWARLRRSNDHHLTSVGGCCSCQ